MACKKKGTTISRVDKNGDEILVGDFILNENTGIIYEVNKYGNLYNPEQGVMKFSYILGELVIVPAEEAVKRLGIPEPKPASKDDLIKELKEQIKGIDELNDERRKTIEDLEKTIAKKEQNISLLTDQNETPRSQLKERDAELARIREGIRDCLEPTEEKIVECLRAHNYTGRLTHPVTVMMETIL